MSMSWEFACSEAQISSFNLACTAASDRLVDDWIRNTMRNVTIVVLVLMMSCQVSDHPKKGPLTSQTRISTQAAMKVTGLPARSEIFRENAANLSIMVQAIPCWLAASPLRRPPEEHRRVLKS